MDRPIPKRALHDPTGAASCWLAFYTALVTLLGWAGWIVIPPPWRYVVPVIWAVMAWIFTRVSPPRGLALLAGWFIGSGAIQVYLSLISPESTAVFILRQAVFLAPLVIGWIAGAQFQRLVAAYRHAAWAARQLARRDSASGLLTAAEFRDRLFGLLVVMQRRGETGYLLRYRLRTGSPSLRDAAALVLGGVLERSTRQRWDLVGRVEPGTLLLALQRCDAVGAELVHARVAETLYQQEGVALEKYADWDGIELQGGPEAVMELLEARGFLPPPPEEPTPASRPLELSREDVALP